MPDRLTPHHIRDIAHRAHHLAPSAPSPDWQQLAAEDIPALIRELSHRDRQIDRLIEYAARDAATRPGDTELRDFLAPARPARTNTNGDTT